MAPKSESLALREGGGKGKTRVGDEVQGTKVEALTWNRDVDGETRSRLDWISC